MGTIPLLEENFLRVLRDRTAGDPMRQEVRWTDLNHGPIAGHLAEAGTPVGVPALKQLLKRHGYVTRKARKAEPMGGHPDRNRQFENVARLEREYLGSDDPIAGMGTKKEELIGNFYRAGHLLTRGVIATFGHDSPGFAEGVAIPHGLGDVKGNDGHVSPGTSHDTGGFACGSIERWREAEGRALRRRARSILLPCDGGGSNGASRYLFKEGPQKLVDRLGTQVRVAHIPPYCSRYNPIEHRLFPHVSRACPGVIFEGVGLVKGLMEKASTSTGLRVTVDVLDQVYRTKRKYAGGFKRSMKIAFDDIMPKWNHRAVPCRS